MRIFERIRSICYCFILKRKGYTIGSNVRIGWHSKLYGKKISIGSNTTIGRNVIIHANSIFIGENNLIYDNMNAKVTQELRLGNRCKISKDARIKADTIVVGNELWCNANWEVGGGGCGQTDAKLYIGDYVHIGRNVFMNVCKEIQIGDQTGIGMDTMIFTHSAGNGQSVLQGYSHTELPVKIGSHVSVFTRVMVSPGATIPDGCTIGAQSFVNKQLCETGFYAGVPCKKMRDIVAPEKTEWTNILTKYFQPELEPSIYMGTFRANKLVEYQKAIFFVEQENYSEVLNYFSEKQNDKQQVVFINLCEPSLPVKHETEFHILNLNINGATNDLSEKVRDMFRRNGIFFTWNQYQPYELNYEKLKKAGVEV